MASVLHVTLGVGPRPVPHRLIRADGGNQLEMTHGPVVGSPSETRGSALVIGASVMSLGGNAYQLHDGGLVAGPVVQFRDASSTADGSTPNRWRLYRA